MLLFSPTKNHKNSKTSQASILTKNRLENEIKTLETLSNIIFIPSPDNDLFSFTIAITAEEGYWKGGTCSFCFDIPQNYPFKAPKIKCIERIYHPNVDSEGRVCLSLLREDYSPALSLEHFVQGLLFILYNPNFSDPLEEHIALLYQTNPKQFVRNVKSSLRGTVIDRVAYTRLIP
jgi:ubiquitin-conjugating enzyme E2 M